MMKMANVVDNILMSYCEGWHGEMKIRFFPSWLLFHSTWVPNDLIDAFNPDENISWLIIEISMCYNISLHFHTPPW